MTLVHLDMDLWDNATVLKDGPDWNVTLVIQISGLLDSVTPAQLDGLEPTVINVTQTLNLLDFVTPVLLD